MHRSLASIALLVVVGLATSGCGQPSDIYLDNQTSRDVQARIIGPDLHTRMILVRAGQVQLVANVFEPVKMGARLELYSSSTLAIPITRDQWAGNRYVVKWTGC